MLKDTIANKYKRIQTLVESDPKNIVNGVTAYSLIGEVVRRQIDNIRKEDKKISEELKNIDASDLQKINERLYQNLDRKIERLADQGAITQEEYDSIMLDGADEICNDEKAKNIELRKVKDTVNKLINKYMMTNPDETMSRVQSERPTLRDEVDKTPIISDYLDTAAMDAINEEAKEGNQGRRDKKKVVSYNSKSDEQKTRNINTLVEEIASLPNVDLHNKELSDYVRMLNIWHGLDRGLNQLEQGQLKTARKNMGEKFGTPESEYNRALYYELNNLVFTKPDIPVAPAAPHVTFVEPVRESPPKKKHPSNEREHLGPNEMIQDMGEMRALQEQERQRKERAVETSSNTQIQKRPSQHEIDYLRRQNNARLVMEGHRQGVIYDSIAQQIGDEEAREMQQLRDLEKNQLKLMDQRNTAMRQKREEDERRRQNLEDIRQQIEIEESNVNDEFLKMWAEYKDGLNALYAFRDADMIVHDDRKKIEDERDSYVSDLIGEKYETLRNETRNSQRDTRRDLEDEYKQETKALRKKMKDVLRDQRDRDHMNANDRSAAMQFALDEAKKIEDQSEQDMNAHCSLE